MKYRCDMIRDLMPICLDHEATDASEQTVIEHMAECAECTQYYKELEKKIEPIGEQNMQDNKYVMLSARIRRRRITVSILVLIFAWTFVWMCLNYAGGYRITSKAAADISCRLSSRSKELVCYKWKDDQIFYIYDSETCYDVVKVKKTWLGWKCQGDSSLIWPKESLYFDDIGIEMAGDLCYFQYDEGIQLFPIIVHDEKVKTVEVSYFGKTQKKGTNAGELILFTFDASDSMSDTVEAVAYDETGKIIYRLDNQGIRRRWVPVTE